MATVTKVTRVANPREKPKQVKITGGNYQTAYDRAKRLANNTGKVVELLEWDGARWVVVERFHKAYSNPSLSMRNRLGRFVKKAKSAVRKTASKIRRESKRSNSAGVHGRRKSRTRTATRQNNPAQIITLGLLGANPVGRSGRTKTTNKKKVSNTSMAAKKTRRRKKTAAVKARRRSRVAAAPRRRRRANPVAAAPRRRKATASTATYKRRRRANPARRRRMARRRNGPSVYGASITSGAGIKMIGGVLGGVALTKILGKFVPVSLRINWLANTAIDGVVAVSAGMLAGRFLGPQTGNAVTLGGLAVAGSTFLNGIMPGLQFMGTPLALSGMGYWAPASFPVPQNPVTAGMAASVAPPAPANVNMSGFSRAFGTSF